MSDRELTEAESQTLERLIDSTSLTAVLETISTICNAKAEHLRLNWQDPATAKLWDSASGLIGITLCSDHIRRVSYLKDN